MSETKTKPQLSARDYEKLGREVEFILVQDYIDALHSTPRQIWNSFIRGLFAGVGGVIGATLGVGLLLFILQRFGGLPVVGEFFRHIGQSIQRTPLH